ncbi:hypothetical protein ACAG39_10325 [Caldicellulosiruptoraceae bacterium PP1]
MAKDNKEKFEQQRYLNNAGINKNQNIKQEVDRYSKYNEEPKYKQDPYYKELEEIVKKIFNHINQEGFYFNEKENFILAENMEHFAKYLNCEFLNNQKKNGITSSSLRNIYDHYLSIKRNYDIKITENYNNLDYSNNVNLEKIKRESFKEIKTQLIFAKAKVNYLVERKIKDLSSNEEEKIALKEVYETLRKFIFDSTKKILEEDENSFIQFEAFLNIFETLVAFMK